MNCKDVINLLPEYINKEVEKDMSGEISRHIRTCPGCKKEYESLRSYFSLTSNLEARKAPHDFLQSLHTVIEKKEKRSLRGIFALLFLPLRFKLPVEAAGILAVSVIIVFFFRPFHVQQDAEYIFTEDEKKSIVEKPGSATRSLIPGSSRDAVVDHDINKTVSRKGRQSEIIAEPAPAPVIYDLSIRLNRQIAPAAAEKESSDTFMKSRMEKKKDSSRAGGVMDIMKSAPAEENLAEEAPRADDEAPSSRLTSLKNLVSTLDGTIEEESLSADGEKKAYIVFTLPAQNYLNLMSELGKYGTVASPKHENPAGQGTVRIRLEIYP